MSRHAAHAAALALLLAACGGADSASLVLTRASEELLQSHVRLAATKPQCEKSCMKKYDLCADKVAKDFSAGRIDDLEPYYEVCSNQLVSCREEC